MGHNNYVLLISLVVVFALAFVVTISVYELWVVNRRCTLCTPTPPGTKSLQLPDVIRAYIGEQIVDTSIKELFVVFSKSPDEQFIDYIQVDVVQPLSKGTTKLIASKRVYVQHNKFLAEDDVIAPNLTRVSFTLYTSLDIQDISTLFLNLSLQPLPNKGYNTT